MKKSLLLASVVMMSAALLSGGASAQGAPQTVDLVMVDVQKLSAFSRQGLSAKIDEGQSGGTDSDHHPALGSVRGRV